MTGLKALLISMLAVLVPIKALVIVAGLLVVADLITGIWAAVKRGESIKSAGIRRTVSKLFVFELAVLVAFLLETYLLSGVPIVKLVGGIIGVTEGVSIFENLNTISGGNLFKSVLAKLGSVNDVAKKESVKREG